VRLLPEIPEEEIEPLPCWTLPPEQERRLMFDAVRRFLANAAGPAGTLLLLDDLQWAGADALELLAALMRQAGDPPLRVVGAYRDTDVAPEHPLTPTLAELADAGLAMRKPVPPLAQREAQELCAHLLRDRGPAEAALHAKVVRRAGGVPFFLVSYARGLAGADGDPAAQEVPWDLRQNIQWQVLALPETARALLATAAVIGCVAPRPLLLAALEQPEHELLAALDGACRAGLLEETGGRRLPLRARRDPRGGGGRPGHGTATRAAPAGGHDAGGYVRAGASRGAGLPLPQGR
jgi:predicted ATPase